MGVLSKLQLSKGTPSGVPNQPDFKQNIIDQLNKLPSAIDMVAGTLPGAIDFMGKKIPNTSFQPTKPAPSALVKYIAESPKLMKALETITNNPVFNKLSALGAGLEKGTKISDLRKVVDPESEKKAEEIMKKAPIISKIGELVGFIAPATGFSKLAGLVAKPLLSKIGSQALKIGTQESIAGVGLGVAQGLVEGKPLKETAKLAGEYGLIGGVGGAGVTKGIEFISKQLRSLKPAAELVVRPPKVIPPKVIPPKVIPPKVIPPKVIPPKAVVTPLGDKVSQFKTVTLPKSGLMKDEGFKSIINELDMTYNTKTHENTINRALKNIKNNYQGEFDKIVNKGLRSSEDTATAGILMKDLKDKLLKLPNDTNTINQIKILASKVQKQGTELGQTIEAFKTWRWDTAEGAILNAQKVINAVERGLEKTNPDLITKVTSEIKTKLKDIGGITNTTTRSEIENLVKQKYKIPTLTDDDVSKIITGMEKSKNLSGRAKEIEIAKVQQLIANKEPASLGEKIKGLQRLSLILNPKTLITRNPLGNILLGAIENIKDIPGAAIDSITSLIRGSERSTLFNPLSKLTEQGKGFAKGLKELAQDVKAGVDTSPSRGQLELPNRRIFDNKVLNSLDQFERNILRLGDNPFYEAAYKSRVTELQKIKKTTELTDDIKDQSKLYALDRVFQGNTIISKSAKKLKESLGIVGDLLIPFTQTPANILDKVLDYTPVGLIKGLYHLGTTIGKGTFNQKLFVDRLARSFTGTGIGILGYTMAKKGLITGGSSKDKDVASFEREIGKLPYSLKLGDKYISFDWAQPIGAVLAAGADSYFAGKNKNDFLEQTTSGITGAGNTIINSSMLQGILRALSGYSPVSGITDALLESTTQVTPTFINQIRQLEDEYLRETYDPSMFKTQLNKLANRIPGLSKILPKKIGTMGEELKVYRGENTLFNVMFNPSNIADFKPNKLQQEILRIYEQSGNKIQFPRVAPKFITLKGETIPLSSDEFLTYQQKLGLLTQKAFGKIMNNQNYKLFNDDKKAKILQTILTKASSRVKEYIIKKKGLK